MDTSPDPHELVNLTDAAHFVVSEAQWQTFIQLLDEPPRELPELKKMFREPPIAESR